MKPLLLGLPSLRLLPPLLHPHPQAKSCNKFGWQPLMPFQAGQSSLVLPRFTSRLCASSTQQLRHEEISIDVTSDKIFFRKMSIVTKML
jgi:hypothetical protein